MVIRLRAPGGQTITFGRFEEGHCLRLTDLLPNGQVYEQLQLLPTAPSSNLARLHQCGNKAVLYRRLIMQFLSVVVDELILNFSTYTLPSGNGATWKVLPKSKKEVRELARRDTYKFVDLHKTQGRIYELVMSYRAYGRRHRRVLRVDYTRYKRLCSLVEAGAPRHPRGVRTRELALRLAEYYPYLEPESVVATCTSFMRLLFGVVRKGLEVRLSAGSTKKGLHLKIYRVNFDFMQVNRRALRGNSRRRRERWVRRRRVFLARAEKLGPLHDLFELNP